jgi:TRAP-type mannitol/chloroaromatic compound transport system permease large subunit
VVLMGVIAFNPMLKAGYDVKLASGVITAGGTLGILIPPSVMIIVYAAVAGQSVVKLYASAMFPGFFLSFLYLVYIIGWALINPKIAPPLPPEQQKVPVSEWVRKFAQAYSRNMMVGLLLAAVMPGKAFAIENDGRRLSYAVIWKNLLAALFPVILSAVTLWGIWWYVVIHQQADTQATAGMVIRQQQASPATASPADQDKPQELGSAESDASSDQPQEAEGVEQVGTPEFLKQGAAAPSESGPPQGFFTYFWLTVAATALLLLWYYWKLEAESFELLKLLISSVMPLGILTIVVLAVILFGITTATESAAIGSAGAFILALQAGTFSWERMKQSVFLTAKTTAMVCWLFIGSALFSGVFAILGGQQLVETWVLSLNMTPIQFMILSQAIIFVLGWPLEWTEIIVIFVPIFLPLLKHFQIDPILWGTLVFVNLQAAFLSPPVAMSAFYLKGVAPKHVTLNQIFAGMMPYMIIVIICMVFMYIWPGMTLWLPNYLYGGG